jgi:putative heme-binding domain-containing protein
VEIQKRMGSSVYARYESARAATTPAQRTAILNEFAAATDDWTRSALVAAASEQAADYLAAALARNDAALGVFVAALAPSVPAARLAETIQAAAASPGAFSAMLLRSLAQSSASAPTLDAPLVAALQKLLNAPETSAAALSLAAKWDSENKLTDMIKQASNRLFTELGNAATPAARRADLAAALVALPAYRSEALGKIGALLADPAATDATRAPLIAAVGELSGREPANVLINAFVQTKSAAIFEQLLKKQESALALLAALKEGRVTPVVLGPGNVARLRTHPNNRVATEATAVLGGANAPSKEKDAVIAKLLPDVEKGGDATKGKTLFAGTCAICHKLGDLGMRDVGTPLAGIGAHPVAELLTNIIDPNRQVEPNYWQWNITTKKGETFTGVIARETNAAVTLRNQGGDSDIKVEDIATRENTRRSLMPEGFENLGAENLRDLIAFLRASASAPAAAAAPTATGAAAAAAVSNPKEGGRGDAPLPPLEPAKWEAGKTRVLIITGGSSHKFHEFFAGTDSATLRAAGYTVHATEDRDQAAELLPQADVAIISVNRKFFDTPQYRKAVMDFAAAGKGIIMLHPGTWYGFPEWPELNAKIVGGGARGHDKLGKYSVNTLKPTHPIMKGVPASFEVEDELYYINSEPDKIPAGTAPIDVLAETSPSIRFKAPHPVVWTTKHERARVVGFTLGHDERVHDHPAYKTLLTNAVKWAAGK